MPKSRAHGTGSIWSEKRAGGREVWVGAFRVGRRQHQRVLGDKPKGRAANGITKTQAERVLREKRREVEAKEAQEIKDHGGEDTVAAVGEAYCVDAETLGGCRPQTVQDYELYLRLHLVPFFGTRPLREIKTKDVEAFQQHQLNKKGLSTSTISGHCNLLHAIFKMGMRLVATVPHPICQLPIAGRDFAILEALVGRNDPCPCEGGRKMKKCLLQKRPRHPGRR
jgi:hypothetical protein